MEMVCALCVFAAAAQMSANKGVGFHCPHESLTGFKQTAGRPGPDLCGDLCPHERLADVSQPKTHEKTASHTIFHDDNEQAAGIR